MEKIVPAERHQGVMGDAEQTKLGHASLMSSVHGTASMQACTAPVGWRR